MKNVFDTKGAWSEWRAMWRHLRNTKPDDKFSAARSVRATKKKHLHVDRHFKRFLAHSPCSQHSFAFMNGPCASYQYFYRSKENYRFLQSFDERLPQKRKVVFTLGKLHSYSVSRLYCSLSFYNIRRLNIVYISITLPTFQ